MFDLTFDTDGVAKKFGLEGTLKTAQIIETGHINNTYLLYYDMGGNKYNKYILQNINTNVFKNPAGLMENIVAVTGYLKERIRESGGDPERETLTFLPADNGNYFYADENGRHWRVYRFVDGTYTRDSIDRPETFYDAGEAFGRFQSMLSGFPIETLHDTIPDFHNTKKRFAALREAVENNLSGRLEFARAEVDFALSKEGEASVLVNLSDAGELPMRVTHNDTKLNNVLFDNKTNKGICVIDLDTVMPGLSLYDFGDAIRFGANSR
ncbi:MAG: aminoglycoside phosphotransferase family protein [Oscillospiraceae bacterium]|nr:aminoglycoside phosphotransferase family protein [Oscillospiraceae bacterium]